MMSRQRVYLYDSTLRDGAQTQGVDFSAADKGAIAGELDRLGIDYIEGGWPGANPTDDAFFTSAPEFSHARLAAFGMTRRAGRGAGNDPGLNVLFDTNAPVLTIVGKTWDFHVDVALGVSREENLAMIFDSIKHAATKVDEVIFDAEHFFDGYKSDPAYTLQCASAAYGAGARWVVLCDTNGGTLPDEIEAITAEVVKEIPGGDLGIHCHDDTGNAVANSLAAVRAGARQVQGTLNGIGERCGNANLISIIPSLVLKMGFETGVDEEGLKRLTRVSRLFDEHLNRAPDRGAPYVGQSAFAHKGGIHASAVEKDPRCYEHIDPDAVGNHRHIVVSGQSGRANIIARFRDIGLGVDADDPKIAKLVAAVKEREFYGYAYDGAEASFELLARRALGEVPEYFVHTSFRVIDERRWDAANEPTTLSEATIKLKVAGKSFMAVAEGNGPVNAMDAAMRKVLQPLFPQLDDIRLVDFKVRILTPADATAAVTRVMIESADGNGRHWSTVGVSANIIDASYNALRDAIIYKLFRDGAEAPAS